MPGGSWSHGRLSMPNENLMLIGSDRHCTPLQGFKIRPTSSQCQDLWNPKSKAWQCFFAFLGTQTESVRETENLRKRSKLARNSRPPSPPVKFLSEAYYSAKCLILMKAIKPRDWRLDLEFWVRAKLLSLGIRSSSAESKWEREFVQEEFGRGDSSTSNLGRSALSAPTVWVGKRWMCAGLMLSG